MSKLNTVPTPEERKALDRWSSVKSVHFVLLVVLIGIASLLLLFPNDVAPIMTVVVGASICLVGASAMSLQHFRRCPRCGNRISKGQAHCGVCGLQYYASNASN